MKKVKLQSLRKQYENLNMKNSEKVSEYISRVIMITNEMKACGETLSEQVIIEKVLRLLTPQFDYIVVEIEHSKDLEARYLINLLDNIVPLVLDFYPIIFRSRDWQAYIEVMFRI